MTALSRVDTLLSCLDVDELWRNGYEVCQQDHCCLWSIKHGKMYFWVQTTHPAADVFAGYQSQDYAVLLASHQSHGLSKHDVYARKEIAFQL